MGKHQKARRGNKFMCDNDSNSQAPFPAAAMQRKQRHENTSKRSKVKNSLVQKKNKMMDGFRQRLDASQFRLLNEELYTCTGAEAQKLFLEQPQTFEKYHSSYAAQRAQWPCDPLDRVMKWLLDIQTNAAKRRKPVIADLGCGDARLAANDAVSKQYKVLSFDLIAANDSVIACDMAHLPNADASIDICIFCLSLMGTNLVEFLVEARRVLRNGGKLLIVEVASRFYNLKKFARQVGRLGFEAERIAKLHDYFIEMEFTKTSDVGKGETTPDIQLKPCLYKKR